MKGTESLSKKKNLNIKAIKIHFARSSPGPIVYKNKPMKSILFNGGDEICYKFFGFGNECISYFTLKFKKPKNIKAFINSKTGAGLLDYLCTVNKCGFHVVEIRKNKKIKIKKIKNKNKTNFKFKEKINLEMDSEINKIFCFFSKYDYIPQLYIFADLLLSKYNNIDDLYFYKILHKKIKNKLAQMNLKRRKKLENLTSYDFDVGKIAKLFSSLKLYEKKCDKQYKKIFDEDRKNIKFSQNLPKLENFLCETKINGNTESFLKAFEDMQDVKVFDKVLNLEYGIASEEFKHLKSKFFFLYYNKQILNNISLWEYDHIYIDGTRDICNIAGVQMVTITIKKNDYKGKQIIFCITNKYDTKTYEKIFELTNFFFINGKHLTVHADYELAIHSSSLKYFKKLVPCYFHYIKIITDNFKGILKTRKASPYDIVSNLLRLVYFCRKSNLEYLLKYCESKSKNKSHEEIIKYIKKHFTKTGRYKKYTGNEYTSEMTNNTAEWFHKFIKSRLSHKGVSHLIKSLDICLKLGFSRDKDKKIEKLKDVSSLEILARLLNKTDYSKHDFKSFCNIMDLHMPTYNNLNTTMKKTKIKI